MDFKKNIDMYRNTILGLLVLVAVTLFGVNHRYAGVGIFVLLIISLFMWNYPKPYLASEVNSLKRLTLFSFIAYPAAVFISLLIHQQWSIIDNELDNPLRFVFVIPIFLLLSKVKLDERWVVAAFSLGAIAIGINSIVTFTGGRVGLSYGNPISMGNVATALAIVSFIVVRGLFKSSLGLKFLSYLGLLLGVSASLLSGTKGGWISLLIVAFLGLYVWRVTYIKKASAVALVFLTLSFFDVAMKNLPSSRLVIFKQNIECFIEDPTSQCGMGSFGVRVWMNLAGVNNFLSHPIIGSGLDTSVTILDQAKKDALIPSNVRSFNHLHNDLVEIISQMGLVGFVGYAFLFGGFSWIALKLRKLSNNESPWATATLMNTILFFEFGMTQATLTHSSTITYFAFSNAILIGMAFRHVAQDEKFLV